jgi:hypothetical protein
MALSPRVLLVALALVPAALAQSPQLFPVLANGKPFSYLTPTFADVDGDGALDVLLDWAYPQKILVRRGNGLGWFGAPTETLLVDEPLKIHCADFDGDGRSEAIVLRDNRELDVLSAFQNGAFSAVTTLQYQGPFTFSGAELATGDFDGDGLLDLAVVPDSPGTNLQVFLGDGAGSFSAPVPSPIANNVVRGLSAADLDSNGLDDLVVTRDVTGLFIYLASGGGAFTQFTQVDNGYDYFATDAADADGDGNVDILVAAQDENVPSSRGVFLVRGDGAGGFQFDPLRVTSSFNATCRIVDLDTDGFADLLAGASLFRGTGAGGFAAEQLVTPPSLFTPIDAADIDGNGLPDLIENEGYAWGYSLATAPLEYGMPIETGLGTARPSSSTAADFNHDGKLDMVVGDEDLGSVRLLYGNGDGTFAPPLAVGNVALPWAITTADFDNNGRLDIAVGSWGAQSVRILLGGGPGGFTVGQAIACGGAVHDLVATDLDGNGTIDIAAATGTGPGVAVLKGLGNGTFSPATTYNVPVSVRGICALDADGDPYRDLAVACLESELVQVLLGTSTGAFVLGDSLAVDGAPWEIAAGDVDGDGDDDLAVTHSNLPVTPILSLLANDGQGNLALFPTQPVAELHLLDVAIVDVDGDGWLDIAVAGGQGNVGYARGNGRGDFERMQYFGLMGGGTPELRSDLVVGDFTGDGRRELATTRRSTRQLFVHEQEPVSLLPLAYCVAKPSSIGCVPSITFDGLPQASATSGFTIGSSDFRNQKSGVLAYSITGHATTPFTGGTLCVAPGVKRTPGAFSGGTPLPAADCSGVLALDFAAFSHGSLGGNPLPALLTPGTSVWAQWVARDPGYAPPNATMLSNALAWTVFP